METNELIALIANRNLINAKSRVLNEFIECLLGGTTDITDYTHVFQKIEGILGEGNLSTELHETVYNLFCDEDFRTTDSSEIDSLCEEIHSIDSAFEKYYDSAESYFDEPVANLFTDLHELNSEQLCEMINLWIKHKEENEQSYFEGLLEEIRKYQEDKNLLIGKLEQHIAPLRNLAEQLLEVDDEEINYWAGNLDEVAHAHVDYPGVQNLSDIQNTYMEEYKEILTLSELYSLEKLFNYIKNRLD
jgi:hypothetical protein